MQVSFRDGAVLVVLIACAIGLAAFQWSDDTDPADPSSLSSCNPTDRTKLLGLDVLCSLWKNHTPDASLSTTAEETHKEAPTVVLHGAVALFLLCGECVVVGAALFGAMVHFTPGVGLRATPRATFASTLAIGSGALYHLVCLGWCLGRLELLQVVCAASACQALLTAAVVLLYAAVVDRSAHAHVAHDPGTPASRRLSPSGSLTHRMARFC